MIDHIKYIVILTFTFFSLVITQQDLLVVKLYLLHSGYIWYATACIAQERLSDFTRAVYLQKRQAL